MTEERDVEESPEQREFLTAIVSRSCPVLIYLEVIIRGRLEHEGNLEGC